VALSASLRHSSASLRNLSASISVMEGDHAQSCGDMNAAAALGQEVESLHRRRTV
jgi:hypothetical protein